MTDSFAQRHIGPRDIDVAAMLAEVGVTSVSQLIDEAVPAAIRTESGLDLPPALTETEALARLQEYANENQVARSYLGMGYHDTITPNVILRNILEDPGWYTAYTPYQAEISQGRLYALLVFQTMVEELTAMPISNASLLDEATAAAEAMTMSWRLSKGKKNRYLVSSGCHPQTLAVMQTRAAPLGIELAIQAPSDFEVTGDTFGMLLQYPASDGEVADYRSLCATAHAHKAFVTFAADLLSLALLTPPGELGADICVGSSQRFGVPMGYGGPHAAFLATTEKHKRQMPGRVIGVSKDVHGNLALRMALQTREQHIRRQKATSNICTAQVLLAVVAAMYAVWHGPEGLGRIARQVHDHTRRLATSLEGRLVHTQFFDTLRVRVDDESGVLARAQAAGINLRGFGDGTIGLALDETVTSAEVDDLRLLLGGLDDERWLIAIPDNLRRRTPYLQHPVFSAHHSETEMLRFLHKLKSQDLALDTSMIPLGSCTMKLNATAEMIPVTWPGFGGLHPFAPVEQAAGYRRLFDDLESWLAVCTGFDAVSLQPNAGSQGEYAGLLTIVAWQRARGESERNVCLIPTSAHGTNPASAVMAGLEVIAVACDDQGNIDVPDLRAQAEAHADRLAALMVTYPSTHGVFEESIRDICDIVHEHGGQVYMDGANMNAMVGLAKPGEIGADVLHLNLHKTFCIPHGGGGPGMGPICVRQHLAQYLSGHPVVGTGRHGPPVAAAPWGSPSILPISWAYIAMMGSAGLTRASQVAILNANYIASRLGSHYPVLYTGKADRVAHECILDLRHFKAQGVTVDDVAKRLIDYGFHAPTMSFPVAGTLMVEPTESESKAELDRFCDAMIAIRGEIDLVTSGQADSNDNMLRNAPHTAASLLADDWDHPYTRSEAAYPAPWTREFKYWPPVGRVDNAWGDRNLICACPVSWPPESS
jgi:glycine dehydrogenase